MTEDYDWLKYDCPDYDGFPHPDETWPVAYTDFFVRDIEIEYCYGVTRQTKSSFRAKPIIAIKHGDMRYHIVTRNALWSFLNAVSPYMGITKTDVAEMCLNVEEPLIDIVEDVMTTAEESDAIGITYTHGLIGNGGSEAQEKVRVILCAENDVIESHPPILMDIMGGFAEAMSGPNRDDYYAQITTLQFHDREGRRTVPTFFAHHTRTGARVYVRALSNGVLWVHCETPHRGPLGERLFCVALVKATLIKTHNFNQIMNCVLRYYFAAIMGADLVFHKDPKALKDKQTSMRNTEVDALYNRWAMDAINYILTSQRYHHVAYPLNMTANISFVELTEQFFLYFLGGEKE